MALRWTKTPCFCLHSKKVRFSIEPLLSPTALFNSMPYQSPLPMDVSPINFIMPIPNLPPKSTVSPNTGSFIVASKRINEDRARTRVAKSQVGPWVTVGQVSI